MYPPLANLVARWIANRNSVHILPHSLHPIRQSVNNQRIRPNSAADKIKHTSCIRFTIKPAYTILTKTQTTKLRRSSLDVYCALLKSESESQFHQDNSHITFKIMHNHLLKNSHVYIQLYQNNQHKYWRIKIIDILKNFMLWERELTQTKTYKQSEDESLTFLSKHMQFRAPKYINGKLESPRMRYLLVGDE